MTVAAWWPVWASLPDPVAIWHFRKFRNCSHCACDSGNCGLACTKEPPPEWPRWFCEAKSDWTPAPCKAPPAKNQDAHHQVENQNACLDQIHNSLWSALKQPDLPWPCYLLLACNPGGVTMELIAFISYMSSKTTVIAHMPIFLAITTFTSILLSLVTNKTSAIVHIHSNKIT